MKRLLALLLLAPLLALARERWGKAAKEAGATVD